MFNVQWSDKKRYTVSMLQQVVIWNLTHNKRTKGIDERKHAVAVITVIKK